MNSNEEVPRSGSTDCGTLFYSAVRENLFAAFRPILERRGAACFVLFVNRKQPKPIAAHESGSTSTFPHYSPKEAVTRLRCSRFLRGSRPNECKLTRNTKTRERLHKVVLLGAPAEACSYHSSQRSVYVWIFNFTRLFSLLLCHSSVQQFKSHPADFGVPVALRK